MTAEHLSALAGALLVLVFNYIPPIKKWYEPIPPDYKQAIMGLALLVVSVAIFFLSCAGVVHYFACDGYGLYELGEMFALALISNVATYQSTKYIGTGKTN